MYRLLSTGTLEENIYQRQIFKGALYDLIHDSNDPLEENGQGRLEAGDDDIDHNNKRSRSRRGRGGSSGQRQQRERRTGVDENDGTVAAGAATKEPGAQGSRGFSQEELKELFVLKTGTKSDTFDKLRRKVPAAAASAAGAEPTAVGRYEQASVEGEPRGISPGERATGGDMVGAAADTLDTADEAWEEYGGPSRVLDKALRHALLEGAAGVVAGSGGGDGFCASVDASSLTASGVVTFVREVKRGGQAGQQHRNTGTVSRSPFAALEGAERNSST